jgi:transcriptional regulator of heat shock response
LVRIGKEHRDKRLQALSVVAQPYHAVAGTGFCACIGPTRMHYAAAIAGVRASATLAARVYGAAAPGV